MSSEVSYLKIVKQYKTIINRQEKGILHRNTNTREIFRIRQSVDIPIFSSTEENSYTVPLYTIGKHLFLLSKNILYRKPTYDM